MKMLVKILIRIAVVICLVYLLPRIYSGFDVQANTWLDAVKVAVVLSLLNTFVKPVLKFFSLPITCLTMGLFSLVISAAIVKIADALLSGFTVGGMWNGWLTALVFSVSFSFFSSLIENFIIDEEG